MVHYRRSRAVRIAGALGLALLASPAVAHIAQLPYSLPVPFWMYAYGATGALLASFLVVGYLARSGESTGFAFVRDLSDRGFVRVLGAAPMRVTLQWLASAALLLSMVTGLFGSTEMSANFNITFFWIVCLLGYTYLTAIVGDWYPMINPWLALSGWVFARRSAGQGVHPYPAGLGYYPALVWYMLLIWFELFGHASPRGLSYALLLYTAVTLTGSWYYGATAWMKYGDVFGVFFRMVAKISPVDVEASPTTLAVRLRAPFAGCIGSRPDHISLVVFVLFMLSSTAFDGAHETLAWSGLFWRDIYPILASVIATHSKRQYIVLVDYYYYWQWSMLFLSPYFYLAIYWVFIATTKAMTRSERTVRELALSFTFSLIPIAFVYNVSHYFTLFVGQAPAIFSIVSDPFGRGWNLFGTRDLGWQNYMFDAGTVWHTQVLLILAGHIVSVYLAHAEALRLFRTGRQATISQFPMLLLMMVLTTIGLWILSMPIASGQVLLPLDPALQ